jgi:hypothetical protein
MAAQASVAENVALDRRRSEGMETIVSTWGRQRGNQAQPVSQQGHAYAKNMNETLAPSKV